MAVQATQPAACVPGVACAEWRGRAWTGTPLTCTRAPAQLATADAPRELCPRRDQCPSRAPARCRSRPAHERQRGRALGGGIRAGSGHRGRHWTARVPQAEPGEPLQPPTTPPPAGPRPGPVHLPLRTVYVPRASALRCVASPRCAHQRAARPTRSRPSVRPQGKRAETPPAAPPPPPFRRPPARRHRPAEHRFLEALRTNGYPPVFCFELNHFFLSVRKEQLLARTPLFPSPRPGLGRWA